LCRLEALESSALSSLEEKEKAGKLGVAVHRFCRPAESRRKTIFTLRKKGR